MGKGNRPKITYSDTGWRQRLTPDQYAICRQKGTERPFSGRFVDTKTQGFYHCVACGERLFSSTAKYDSGSGWPSFYEAENKHAVEEQKDVSQGMRRTEILCARCDSHLGHVFEDGPVPTGLRYCVNALSLEFKPEDDTQENNIQEADT